MRARWWGCAAMSLACASDPDGRFDPTVGADATVGGDATSSSSTTSAATTAEPTTTASDDAASDASSTTAAEPPPFRCDAMPTDSPVLGAAVWFAPATPHEGDTLTVVIQAGNGLEHADAPPMQLQLESASGTAMHEPQMRAGGAALYYYSIADMPVGDVCVLSLIDGAPETSAKVVVTERPPGPPAGGGVYKVTTNHQWTCDEQPDWGNELHLRVLDEDGAPIPEATIRVAYTDDTDPDSIKNGDSNPVPSSYVTNADGAVDEFDWWPTSGHGFLVLRMWIDGAPSDVATEITTGWWESDDAGCRYCPPDRPINVWGHWSHSVVFQRSFAATQVCEVPSDHAGQAACGPPGHLHHDPAVQACWAVR